MMLNVENNTKSNYDFIKLTKDLLKPLSINQCPHCQSSHFIKYGKFKNNQRYLCKDCERTFCNKTNTPMYYSKKDSTHWEKYINLMISNTNLRTSANMLNITLETSFYWRHKLLDAFNLMFQTKELCDYVEMRKFFLKENYKGNRKNIVTSRKKVLVIASSDCYNDTFAIPISLDFWKKNNFYKLVYPKINKNSYINAFGDNYLKAIAKIHNKEQEEKDSSNSKETINNFINNIKGIISKCHGVATKYLPHYFALAKYITLNYKFNFVDLLIKTSIYFSYIARQKVREMMPIYESL